MWKKAVFIIILYPILWVIDLFMKSQLLISYHDFLMKWWPYGVVIVMTYFAIRKLGDFKYEEMEKLRESQFFSELRRYRNTPFISPVMLMYLINPPRAYRPYDSDYVNNTFYRTVVNAFRDRVYIMSDYRRPQPERREPYLKVVGWKTCGVLFIYFSAPFSWLTYWVFADPSMLIKGWPLFTIPFVIYGLIKCSFMIQAIMDHHPKQLERLIKSESAYQEPQTWREAFPDKSLGITILRAYEMEKESRMRYHAMLKRIPVPETTIEFHHASFPPYPLPSQHLPPWTNEMEEQFINKATEWSEPGSTKSNVVPLRRKMK
ncbi:MULTISPECIES: hypothetical protein [unclassified Sporosarcina]|uniref:hypothetical protein n=1 Tax=unclassified Sporosarcina TaxID=2647733 RepID=UPI001A910C4E|nr:MULTISPECIES: hypothetical protein [unclassified Sporosarcina]MBO0588173.1 hypothetical protein [Sporosarcina sp. E16_8]MBO0601927.1 hypothetical protein [Sporosarcina sp. E16_3]